MTVRSLTAEEVRSLLLAVCKAVEAAKDQLSQADRDIGDGDHGIGMAKGFRAAGEILAGTKSENVFELFALTGRTLMRVMGGASGIIFGLFFCGGAKDKQPRQELSGEALAELLAGSLAEIKAKGRAQPGDKTMVDAFEPMVQALQASAAVGKPLPAMLAAAKAAADAGCAASRQYTAKFGKAKPLGERAIGFPDPGAVSVTVIAAAMHQWAADNIVS